MNVGGRPTALCCELTTSKPNSFVPQPARHERARGTNTDSCTDSPAVLSSRSRSTIPVNVYEYLRSTPTVTVTPPWKGSSLPKPRPASALATRGVIASRSPTRRQTHLLGLDCYSRTLLATECKKRSVTVSPERLPLCLSCYLLFRFLKRNTL